SSAEMKLVVLDSEILPLGSVVLVDGHGVSIGRDRVIGNPRLRLNEIVVSRFHATIFEDVPLVDVFHIVDVGSMYGTSLNGQRLSESKVSSSPTPLSHGDILKVGSSQFQVHIHPQWPCDDCKVTSSNVISTRHDERRLKRAALGEPETRARVALALRREGEASESSGYIDRAALRRKEERTSATDDVNVREFLNGAQPDWEVRRRTGDEASVPIPEADPLNVGSRMLAKMGWAAGTGLGKDRSGRVDPV
ncbi:SMAD/FHA domain-containing protein, partial [Blyttiomyces helicus]